MGQYWLVVNLDKKEYISPHALGCGLKLWEQLANHPSTGTALLILCAAMPEVRGGGDFDMEENWHGPERKDHSRAGSMPESYPEIAKQTIGRWAGDRIALIGDYAKPGDLAGVDASKIYDQCAKDQSGEYKDVSDLVCVVIEHELNGKFVGEGWKDFKYDTEKKVKLSAAMPDMMITKDK